MTDDFAGGSVGSNGAGGGLASEGSSATTPPSRKLSSMAYAQGGGGPTMSMVGAGGQRMDDEGMWQRWQGLLLGRHSYY